MSSEWVLVFPLRRRPSVRHTHTHLIKNSCKKLEPPSCPACVTTPASSLWRHWRNLLTVTSAPLWRHSLLQLRLCSVVILGDVTSMAVVWWWLFLLEYLLSIRLYCVARLRWFQLKIQQLNPNLLSVHSFNFFVKLRSCLIENEVHPSLSARFSAEKSMNNSSIASWYRSGADVRAWHDVTSLWRRQIRATVTSALFRLCESDWYWGCDVGEVFVFDGTEQRLIVTSLKNCDCLLKD